jgi:hypothetical protein
LADNVAEEEQVDWTTIVKEAQDTFFVRHGFFKCPDFPEHYF